MALLECLGHPLTFNFYATGAFPVTKILWLYVKLMKPIGFSQFENIVSGQSTDSGGWMVAAQCPELKCQEIQFAKM